MSVEDFKKEENVFFTDKRKEIEVELNGKKYLFYANAVSFFSSQKIGIDAVSNEKNSLAMLVAETISDKDGNKFTYDEVLKLDRSVADKFFKAAMDVNAKVDPEKK